MKLVKIALPLLAVVALASCYWNFGSGSLEIDVSGVQPRQIGDVVRVYLVANGLLFSTDGSTPFSAEVPLTGSFGEENRILIEGLPVGPQYQALVGVGPVNGGVFQVYYWGETDFTVAAGRSTPVDVTLNSSDFSESVGYGPELFGKHIKGVMYSGQVYAAEDSRLHSIYMSYDGMQEVDVPYISATYDLPADIGEYGLASHRINGLSRDDAGFSYYGGLMNSSGGIVPFQDFGEGWGFDSAFASNLAGSRSILESGTLYDDSDQYYYLFFRRAGGLGGASVYIEGQGYPENYDWANVDLVGVRDMVVSGNYAYFTTGGSTFALPPAFLRDEVPSLAGHRMDIAAPAEVLSLGFYPAAGFSGGTLYLGTTNGLWQTTVTEELGDPPDVPPSLGIGTWTQTPETAGQPIEFIEVNPSSGYAAYLSRYFLYIRMSSMRKAPFFAVVPGKATGLAWDYYSGYLHVSGTEGLSSLYVGFC